MRFVGASSADSCMFGDAHGQPESAQLFWHHTVVVRYSSSAPPTLWLSRQHS